MFIFNSFRHGIPPITEGQINNFIINLWFAHPENTEEFEKGLI